VKSVGGSISISIRIRTPLGKTTEREERILCVGQWPDLPRSTSTEADAPSSSSASAIVAANIRELNYADDVKSSSLSMQGQQSSDALKYIESPMGLTDKEIKSPFDVSLYESNDCMEEVIRELETRLCGNIQEAEKLEISRLKSQFEIRLNSLVSLVQKNEITLDEYLSKVKNRLSKDKMLAIYFRQKNELVTALKIMKRVATMEVEIKGAEGCM